MSNDKPPVVKLAQPGYDVKTAGDENLIYSSKWPLLPIIDQGSVTFDVAQDTIIAEHNLGFPTFFWTFVNLTEASTYEGFGLLKQAERSEFSGLGQVNSSKLIYKGDPFSLMTGSFRMYYYIFALDLTKQYNAPIIRQGDIQAARGSRVFKIAKEGKDISSDDLFDFIIHSCARSPMIHSVNPGVVEENLPSGAFGFRVAHDLGYAPMFFGLTQNSDGSYSMLPTGIGGATQFTCDSSQALYQEGASGRKLTIIILKDPFSISYSRRVNT